MTHDNNYKIGDIVTFCHGFKKGFEALGIIVNIYSEYEYGYEIEWLINSVTKRNHKVCRYQDAEWLTNVVEKL